MTIEALWEASGAAAWGTVSYQSLLPHMDLIARTKAQALCPAPAGVWAAAFPYFAGDAPGSLSRYARGEDYHTAVLRRLEGVCRGLEALYPGRTFVPGTDDSPIPEEACARLAGLGLRGQQGLTILPPWGTWLFLGTILTDLPLETPGAPAPDCIRCGRCAAACPGGAISGQGVDPSKCLSHLTQKKGELTAEQEALLRAHPMVWGCDICQEVCPYNAGVPITPLAEFREDLILALDPADVAGLTRRQFEEKYPNRAFTWRGPGVIERNQALQGFPSGGSWQPQAD